MKTPEQARVAGNKIRQILLDLAVNNKDIVGMLDESKSNEEHVLDIRRMLDIVNNDIRPKYSEQKILLYEHGRSVRSFEFEAKRLLRNAIGLYVESLCSASPVVKNFLADSESEGTRSELFKLLQSRIENITIPFLRNLETPGDDFLILTYDLINNLEDQKIIKIIAETEKTPSELENAFWAMLGLLIEAKRAELQGKMDVAYSFLLDANHLIGLHQGSLYVMTRMSEVAKKQRARMNSAKSREKLNKAKVRAYQLFLELRPVDDEGKPKCWNKAVDATNAVWDRLTEEAYANSEEEPNIKYSTVKNLCQRLHKKYIKGGVVEIRTEVLEILPDGTELKLLFD